MEEPRQSKILIVEDEQTNALITRRLVKNLGHIDQVATNGYEAIGMATAELPDLILMDIMMPDIDGIEVTRQLKRRPEFFNVPVIMVTGASDAKLLKEAFDAGATDYVTKGSNPIELTTRLNSALQLKYEVEQRMLRESQLEEAINRLEQLSLLDQLTGIGNRRYFDDLYDRQWRAAKRKHCSIAVVMLDVDDFKRYNDTLGHPAGDECLKKVANALNKEMRRPSDSVSRYGGEEFVAILFDTDARGALEVAERMRKAIHKMKLHHPGSRVCDFVTLSGGIACVIPDGDLTQKQLLESADKALYQAKENGRDRFSVSAQITA
ncbi:GGDEF domain-containing response regulator [Pelagibaculum spongiae]|uniref:diguanylate cyclase n=1 Tax=Pelagibaculum spongiae TaxID=2080658 RepID=A0A2V1GYC6_9GAMM|nr:diguanylate cyclase [Pelagibaculum spongiae]PVZ72084.1 diguanylate cyclase response regulator [Pelagibaculum spongiae]